MFQCNILYIYMPKSHELASLSLSLLSGTCCLLITSKTVWNQIRSDTMLVPDLQSRIIYHFCSICLTLYLLLSSADNFCKQFGPRSGSKLFDTPMVFLKEFFKKVDFEKKHQTTKKHVNELNITYQSTHVRPALY